MPFGAINKLSQLKKTSILSRLAMQTKVRARREEEHDDAEELSRLNWLMTDDNQAWCEHRGEADSTQLNRLICTMISHTLRCYSLWMPARRTRDNKRHKLSGAEKCLLRLKFKVIRTGDLDNFVERRMKKNNIKICCIISYMWNNIWSWTLGDLHSFEYF